MVIWQAVANLKPECSCLQQLARLSSPTPLGIDKVSMLTHAYLSLPPPPPPPPTPTRPRKIEVTICKHQADSLLHVWPDV